MEVKSYKGEDFEVLWKPGVCIHSTLCWKNLKPVFDPFRRPWIVLENGEREAIKNQVLACPSGALLWVENSSNLQSKVVEPHIPEDLLHIEQSIDGPLLVKGDFLLIHPDGKRELKQKTTALCRCGASSNKPFCDGSHKKIEFKS
jgi:uncharacterized Fe-S cluster protein YjdI